MENPRRNPARSIASAWRATARVARVVGAATAFSNLARRAVRANPAGAKIKASMRTPESRIQNEIGTTSSRISGVNLIAAMLEPRPGRGAARNYSAAKGLARSIRGPERAQVFERRAARIMRESRIDRVAAASRVADSASAARVGFAILDRASSIANEKSSRHSSGILNAGSRGDLLANRGGLQTVSSTPTLPRPRVAPRAHFASPKFDRLRAVDRAQSHARTANGAITLNSSPTVVINGASGDASLEARVMAALQRARGEIFDQLARESAMRERSEF